jgi:hypothetical protein
MTMRIILPLMAVLAIGGAYAEDAAKPPPFDASKYPAEVQMALGYASDECKAHDGGEATLAANTVTTLDLTGDGRDDYIVQFGDTQCAAATRAVFCGTGGCLMNILVTLPNGKVRKVFDGYVRSYDIRPDPSKPIQGPRTIGFELHGGYCGGHGTPSCPREKRITTTPFDFKMPK